MTSSRGYWLAGACLIGPTSLVEVVADAKFLEQGVQQRTRPIETVCPLCESPEIVDPTVASPVMEPADRLVPSG